MVRTSFARVHGLLASTHVKTPLSSLARRVALALAATVALVGPAAVPAPAHAVPAGDLTVRILDATGLPANGLVAIFRAGEGLPDEVSQAPDAPGEYRFTDLPAGRYGVLTMTPWGGLTCAGVSPCEFAALQGISGITTVGAVDVTVAEAPAVHTLRTAVPGTVTGKSVVGNALSITWSSPMATMLAAFGTSGPTVQWLRDGAPIPGAVATTYTTTGADQGHLVSARLAYLAGGIWSSFGAAPTPYTLAGRTVTKAASRTTVDIVRKKIAEGRSPGIRIDVTADNLPAPGQVKVTIGKRTYTKTLRNGSARVPVPGTLRPGRYRVVAKYLGTSSYSPSRASGVFTVVRKR